MRHNRPVPELRATTILAALKRHGVTHVVGLPDNGSRALFESLTTDGGIDLIGVTREGEAYAVAAGLFIGGRRPFVAIQNTGFLESGDAIRGTAVNMGLPLVSLIGYRGFESLAPRAKRIDTAATFLEPTLEAWGIPYWRLDNDDGIGAFDEAFRMADEGSAPTAIVYPGFMV